MSDFFIGGLLVFSLLLPILLRPFFRGMHALGGIPVLAVPAVFLCAGLLVTGTRLLFFPLFAFTVLVLLSQTGRMISLARGLPSDWFSAGTKALSVLGLAMLAVLAFFSVRWIPEPLYLPGREIRTEAIRENSADGFRYTFFLFQPEKPAAPDEPVLLYFSGFPAGRFGRPTLAAIAAEKGFAAVIPAWSGRGVYPSAAQDIRIFRDLQQTAVTALRAPEYTPEQQETGVRYGILRRVIPATAAFAAARFPGRPLYAVAEGDACQALADTVNADPQRFAGSVYLLPESRVKTFAEPDSGCAYTDGPDMPFPPAAATLPGTVISGGKETAFGLGETAAEDPALAALLHIPRDKDRKLAQLTAGRVISWITQRNRMPRVFRTGGQE